MKRNLDSRIKNLTDKVFPSIASATSIVAISYHFIHSLDASKTKYLSIIAVIAGTAIAILTSYLFLRVVLQKKEGNVFISYSHEDKKFVDRLVQRLKVKRFNIFYDEAVVKIGDNILDTIMRSIKNSDVFVLVLSKNSSRNEFLNRELKYALENSKKILPILIDGETKPPSQIEGIKYADFTTNYETSVRNLTKALVSALENRANPDGNEKHDGNELEHRQKEL